MMQAELRADFLAPGVPAATLFAPEGGKMFGVLVVQEPGGEVGFLRSFSGLLAGQWEVPGFVPPLFDRIARARIEPAGEIIVKSLLARAEALRTSPALVALQHSYTALQSRHHNEQAALRTQHDLRKRQRHTRRIALTTVPLADREREAAQHTLAQESRSDKAEQRRLEARQHTELQQVEPQYIRLKRRQRAYQRLRIMTCRALMKQIHDTYWIVNTRGERRSLRSLFAPGEPPSGAADCAGPKLLAHAHAHHLRPLALAEFWWGAAPATGGRVTGDFYPACRDKCGPLLPFMLQGLPVTR